MSYAREDEARAQELAAALERHGYSVFWDRHVPPGETWDNYIGGALAGAKCVVVAWSSHSVASKWVREEAHDGSDRNALVPVLFEPVTPPLGFRAIQAASLIDWRADRPSPAFEGFLKVVGRMVGARAASPDSAAAVPGSGPRAPPEAAELLDEAGSARSSWLRRPFAYYSWNVEGRRWVWALVPILWLFFCTAYSVGPAELGLDYLLIPVAAWLGAHHGATGYRALTVGTLPLLVIVGFGGLTIGADPPALFLVLQIVCRLFGQREYRLDCLRATSVTQRQLLYLFVILAVYLDWVGAFGNLDVLFGTQVGTYITVIFLVLGMSGIKFKMIAAPFLCIATLSFLAESIETAYMFPRVAGFRISLIYAGYESIDSAGTAFFIECLTMYFVGTLLRSFLAARTILSTTTLDVVCGLIFFVYVTSNLSIVYSIIDEDNGSQLRAVIEFGTAFAGAALLFAAGAVGERRGAVLAIGIWLLVCVAGPLAILAMQPGPLAGDPSASLYLERTLLPGGAWADPNSEAFSSENLSAPIGAAETVIIWSGPGHLVGTSIALLPGWSVGPFDPLFAVFGWLVHRAIVRQPGWQAAEEAAVAAGNAARPGVSAVLPPLQLRYMDRFWIWPTGLIVVSAVVGVLAGLVTLVPAILATW